MAEVSVDVNGIEFGRRYRDTATDFEGVATAVWLKQSGEISVSLAYLDSAPNETWVEASRLTLIDVRKPPGVRNA